MSKYFNIEKGVLNFRRGHEIIRIEGWGKDALRVRTTENKKFTKILFLKNTAILYRISTSINASTAIKIDIILKLLVIQVRTHKNESTATPIVFVSSKNNSAAKLLSSFNIILFSIARLSFLPTTSFRNSNKRNGKCAIL